ncbi:MAG: D-Ala-D-Ala carboxypeptidase family metallohydrolase [Candidatus Paceibacterota bacterium]|jgi:hypothetical protein
MPEQLSDHFSFEEFTDSSAHPELVAENRAAAASYMHAIISTAYLIERARIIVGCPLHISSGFRCAALNSAVGGAPDSQHCRGEAADIIPSRMSPLEAFERLRKTETIMRMAGQLILEPGWIHISLGAPWRPANKCGQVLRMTRGADGNAKYSIVRPEDIL